MSGLSYEEMRSQVGDPGTVLEPGISGRILAQFPLCTSMRLCPWHGVLYPEVAPRAGEWSRGGPKGSLESEVLALTLMTEQLPGLLHIQDPVTVGFRDPRTPLLTELALVPMSIPLMTSVPFSDYNVSETSWISLCCWHLVPETFT